MRISDWSSDVCSSDLKHSPRPRRFHSVADSEIDRNAPIDEAATEAEGRVGRIGQIGVVEPVIIAVDHAIRCAVGIFVEQVIGADRELDRVDGAEAEFEIDDPFRRQGEVARRGALRDVDVAFRSEEHTSELQSLMRISYDVFCLKKKNMNNNCTNRYAHHSPETPTAKNQ